MAYYELRPGLRVSQRNPFLGVGEYAEPNVYDAVLTDEIDRRYGYKYAQGYGEIDTATATKWGMPLVFAALNGLGVWLVARAVGADPRGARRTGIAVAAIDAVLSLGLLALTKTLTPEEQAVQDAAAQQAAYDAQQQAYAQQAAVQGLGRFGRFGRRR